jgi:hypothetical protein
LRCAIMAAGTWDAAVARLEQMQQEQLPEGDPARFVHGRYVLSARIVGDLKPLNQCEVLEILPRLQRYTGWSPLNVSTREELKPYPVGDHIVECWLAREEGRDVGHADFWRVSTEGMVTLVRGFKEDDPSLFKEGKGPEPGKGIELSMPTWRIGDFLLRVRELAQLISTGPFRLQLIVQWEGVHGRKLFGFGGRHALLNDYVAHESDIVREAELSPEEIDSALPAVIESIVTPILRRFSFFEPPASFHAAELGRMLRREYA